MARLIEACLVASALVLGCGGPRFATAPDDTDASANDAANADVGDSGAEGAEGDSGADADSADSNPSLVVALCGGCPTDYDLLNWSASAACGGCTQANCGWSGASVLATADSQAECLSKFGAPAVAKVVDCNTAADVYICAR